MSLPEEDLKRVEAKLDKLLATNGAHEDAGVVTSFMYSRSGQNAIQVLILALLTALAAWFNHLAPAEVATAVHAEIKRDAPAEAAPMPLIVVTPAPVIEAAPAPVPVEPL